jgi:hypothetical protein
MNGVTKLKIVSKKAQDKRQADFSISYIMVILLSIYLYMFISFFYG